MKILPAVTQPWPERIVRRHTPQATRGDKGYQLYRPCLRWEFGFSCAFCLCHEADLAPYPIEGSGLTQVEHFVRKSGNESGRNSYSNCFYICRFCNISRGTAPNEGANGRLINPCDRAWAEAFVKSGDQFQVRYRDDLDAEYTLETYNLNRRQKLWMRRSRRVVIQQCVAILEATRTFESELLDRAGAGSDEEVVATAKGIAAARRKAYRDLFRFRPIPCDRNTSCRCGHADHHRLPSVLEEQLVDLSYLRRIRSKPLTSDND